MKSQGNNDCFKGARGRRAFLLLLWGYMLCSGMHAQSSPEIPLVYESTLVGIGSASVYDTYLSPLEYTGANFGVLHEQMNRTGLFNGRIFNRHLFNLEFSGTENPTGTASNYVGSLEYGYGLYYRFNPVYKLQFFAGMQADGLFGVIYNTRNGNNPISGKVNLNLNISGIVSYKFRIKQQPLQLRYQLNVAVVGGVFSPQFGQSYYEIGLGDQQGLFHFASFHNQLIINNLFSVELPFNSFILRLACMNRIYETRINSLDTRIVSNSFYIGFSKNFYVVSGKENKNNYRYVFE
jgi:hypothetical protein